ncbi:ankyrin repeat-containing domain protein, partial [Phaeosphaeriaceae sp. PMI808]
ADLEERDASSATPLHRAVERKDREWMQWLIEKGANKNSRDENGCSPLHYAIWTRDDGTIAGYLLESGADISAIDRFGNTPLHSAASASNLAVLRVCIAWAHDINISDSDGNTPLHHAADDDWVLPGRIQELVGAGANVHACNHSGKTPLHVAVEGQRPDNAEALLKCRAQVNAGDKDGATPL